MENETIIVPEVVVGKTHAGKVHFPVAVPEGLAEHLRMPDDFVNEADTLGLDSHAMKFILGVTRGRAAMSVELDLPELATKLGMSFAEMDRIVCDLVQKGYAEMGQRLSLYRLWVTVLHLRGIRFDIH